MHTVTKLSTVCFLTDYKYNVTLFTGDKPGAGTDANVCVTLFGEMGDSGENFLKKAFKRNRFVYVK